MVKKTKEEKHDELMDVLTRIWAALAQIAQNTSKVAPQIE